MFLLKYCLALGLALSVVEAAAAPAAWYKWRSAQGEVDVCAQTSPGPGWQIIKGPFQDALCRKPGTPKGHW